MIYAVISKSGEAILRTVEGGQIATIPGHWVSAQVNGDTVVLECRKNSVSPCREFVVFDRTGRQLTNYYG